MSLAAMEELPTEQLLQLFNNEHEAADTRSFAGLALCTRGEHLQVVADSNLMPAAMVARAKLAG